jgi:hypothetical protein
MERTKPVCLCCRSSDILFDAYAHWNQETQAWEVHGTYDKGSYCRRCDDDEARVEWVPVDAPEPEEDDE